ncbi:MAG: hypothetical protein ABR511_08370 [Acidimicrobiales bacterium]
MRTRGHFLTDILGGDVVGVLTAIAVRRWWPAPRDEKSPGRVAPD